MNTVSAMEELLERGRPDGRQPTFEDSFVLLDKDGEDLDLDTNIDQSGWVEFNKAACLGSGARAKVYRVRHKHVGRSVENRFAAKPVPVYKTGKATRWCQPEDADRQARKTANENLEYPCREMRIMSELSHALHPHIIKYFGSCLLRADQTAEESDRKPVEMFLFMELCDTTLGQVPDDVPETQRYRWLLQLASAIQHMHKLNIVHNDLSNTKNVFLRDGEVRLADFGESAIYQDPDDNDFEEKKRADVLAMLRLPAFAPLADILETFKTDLSAGLAPDEVLQGIEQRVLELSGLAPITLPQSQDHSKWNFPTDGLAFNIPDEQERFETVQNDDSIPDNFKLLMEVARIGASLRPSQPLRLVIGHSALADMWLRYVLKTSEVHDENAALSQLRADVCGNCLTVEQLVRKHQLLPSLHLLAVLTQHSVNAQDPLTARLKLKSMLRAHVFPASRWPKVFNLTFPGVAILAEAIDEVLGFAGQASKHLQSMRVKIEIRPILRVPGNGLKFVLQSGESPFAYFATMPSSEMAEEGKETSRLYYASSPDA